MSKILPLTFLLRFATQALASVATLPNRSLGLQDACVGFAVRLALPLKGEEEKREKETIGGVAIVWAASLFFLLLLCFACFAEEGDGTKTAARREAQGEGKPPH